MKFCKNLQKVCDLSDPEWTPFWPNYKMLKKLIKELPSLVPSDDHRNHDHPQAQEKPSSSRVPEKDSGNESSNLKQQRGDRTTESETQQSNSNHASIDQPQDAGEMTKSPGEVAFFKLLHSELRKAIHFFDRATEEFTIREARVREGMDIMRQPNSIMVNDKWTLMAKSIYRLYRDLLLLETYAIMSYCAFSKILKKHDKMTGYSTRNAFMKNMVNKANFTNYPAVLAMINRCERLYEEVSKRLLLAGQGRLYEDERLFINMISRLNEQVLSSDKDEVDATHVDAMKRPTKTMSASGQESPATSKVRWLVEEIDRSKAPAKVAQCSKDGDTSEDRPIATKKRSSQDHARLPTPKKSRT